MHGTVDLYMGIGIDSNMVWQNLARGLIISLRQELGPMIVYGVKFFNEPTLLFCMVVKCNLVNNESVGKIIGLFQEMATAKIFTKQVCCDVLCYSSKPSVNWVTPPRAENRTFYLRRALQAWKGMICSFQNKTRPRKPPHKPPFPYK